ncbi:MAG: pyridoxal-phosphate dependent enzyme [Deinococcales bacterium]
MVSFKSGNHGAAVAFALRALRTKGLICVPHGAAAAKLKKIGDLGAELYHVGQDGLGGGGICS